MFNAALPAFLRANLDSVDYLEIIPDTFWTDLGDGAAERFLEIEPYVELADWASDRVPIVAHNLGLSLGTSGPLDHGYLAQLASWQRRYRVPWHSDHLSFARVPGEDGHEHAGVAVPVPFDEELLDAMSARIAQVRAGVPVPFLVENSVYFLDIPEQEMSEPEFLNALAVRADCGLLLDLHNLYANARNHDFDAFAFVDQLDLEKVIEIHIAGGSEFAGMWTDSHSGPCPEPVWDLLDWVLPRGPHIAGVTFEFHDSYFPALGDDGVRAELERARDAWDRSR